MKDAAKDEDFGEELSKDLVNKRFHQEALKHPDETLLFDSVKEQDLESAFLMAKFYNELEKGVTLNEF